MASTSEKGHYKNVTALEKMILKATAMGALYNPSKAAIKLSALQALWTSAKADYAAVSTAATPFNNAVNDRILVFENYKTFATQIVAAFSSSSDANPQKVKDLKTINRKIQGTRTPKKELNPVEPDAIVPETISASQQSYDMRYDHFVKLVDILISETTYAPNEPELKLAAIQAYKANLLAANTAVATAHETVNNTRIKRDKTMYKDTTGLYDVQLLVKEYVKSALKATSIQYKQMVAISFYKPKKIYV